MTLREVLAQLDEEGNRRGWNNAGTRMQPHLAHWLNTEATLAWDLSPEEAARITVHGIVFSLQHNGYLYGDGPDLNQRGAASDNFPDDVSSFPRRMYPIPPFDSKQRGI